MPLLPSAIEIIVGIVLLFGGGELFVGGSTAVALLFGIPQIVIGLTVVSLGTSAPELFVSLISTIQGGDDIAVSNIVGSNIFNVLVVLGLSALVVPLRVKSRLVRRDVPLLLGVSMAVWGMASGGQGLTVDPVMVNRDFPIMVLTTLACLPIFWSHGVISRLEGGILVGLYGLYLVEQVLTNTVTSAVDEFRFVALVAILPLVFVFLVWQTLRWRHQRHA